MNILISTKKHKTQGNEKVLSLVNHHSNNTECKIIL